MPNYVGRIGGHLQVRPPIPPNEIPQVDLNLFTIRPPYTDPEWLREPPGCTVIAVVDSYCNPQDALAEVQAAVTAIGAGYTYSGYINGATRQFERWRIFVSDGVAVIENAVVTFPGESVVIEHETLNDWTGRDLTAEQVTQLAQHLHLTELPGVVAGLADTLFD